MIGKERKAMIALEANLLASKDVRHPFVSYGDMLPFSLFSVSFVSATIALLVPIWVSVGVVPTAVFAICWYLTRAARDNFYEGLKKAAERETI